jgi:hypothetical protein
MRRLHFLEKIDRLQREVQLNQNHVARMDADIRLEEERLENYQIVLREREQQAMDALQVLQNQAAEAAERARRAALDREQQAADAAAAERYRRLPH